jgi:hypothetical protein
MYITVLITPMVATWRGSLKKKLGGRWQTAPNDRADRGFEAGSPARRAPAATLCIAALLCRAACSAAGAQ